MTPLIEGTQPEGITTEELADRFGVTPQTVRNWARRGMKPLTTGVPGVSARFDPVACEKWARANRMETGHGGERAGAGKPKRRPGRPPGSKNKKRGWRDGGGAGEPLIDHAEKRQRAMERVAELAGRDAADPEALDLAADLCKLEPSDLVILASIAPEASGLTPAAIGRLDKLETIQLRQLERMRTMGTLVRASDVRERAAEVYGECRAAIDASSKDIARDLAALLELDGEGHKKVEKLVREKMVALVERLREIGSEQAEAA